MNSKVCKTCRQEKPVEEFHKSKAGRLQRSAHCKTCSVAIRKNYHQNSLKRHDIIIPDFRQCGRCGETKSAEYFCRVRSNKDGLNRICLACGVIYSRRYAVAQHTKSPVLTRLKTMLIQSRIRAKKRSMAFDLDIDFLVEQFGNLTHCPILNLQLDWKRTGGHAHNSPSLDRIDQSGGYTRENVQVISRKANTMKNDASIEELRLFGQWCFALSRR